MAGSAPLEITHSKTLTVGYLQIGAKLLPHALNIYVSNWMMVVAEAAEEHVGSNMVMSSPAFKAALPCCWNTFSSISNGRGTIQLPARQGSPAEEDSLAPTSVHRGGLTAV